jgi:hypothetical protein
MMPEMATSMLQSSTNRALWPLVSVISDGATPASLTAAIGHVTPDKDLRRRYPTQVTAICPSPLENWDGKLDRAL